MGSDTGFMMVTYLGSRTFQSRSAGLQFSLTAVSGMHAKNATQNPRQTQCSGEKRFKATNYAEKKCKKN